MMDTTRTGQALLAASLLLGSAWIAPASAATVTTQFQVTITITSTCSFDSTTPATDVAFGSVTSAATNVAAAGQLNATCTKGTAYQTALDQGLNGTSTSSRAMIGGTGSDTVAYQLYQDSGHATAWGNNLGVDTLGGTGTGAAQAIPVYGLVASANSPAGSYTDTIIATINF